MFAKCVAALDLTSKKVNLNIQIKIKNKLGKLNKLAEKNYIKNAKENANHEWQQLSL